MFTKLKLALALAAPLAAGATTYAAAQGPGGPHAARLQKFDADGDGQLDPAERQQMKAAWQDRRAARKQAVLEKFDADRDGQLDPAERQQMKAAFAQKREARLVERFARLDADGDGQLSLEEYRAARRGHGRHHRGFGDKHRFAGDRAGAGIAAPGSEP